MPAALPWPFPRRSELRARAEARRDSVVVDPAAMQLEAGFRTDSLMLAMLDQPGALDEGGGFRVSQWLADWLYEYTWMAVVADIVPDWGTSSGYDLPGLPGDVAEELQATAEDLELDAAINMAWKFARKDGGGALVKVLNDGQPSDRPVDYANLTSVVAVVPLDRYELVIIDWGNTGTGIGPVMYQDQRGQQWHHSRVIPFINRELALRRRPFYQYWSLGEFDRVYSDFLRDRDVQQALAKLLKEYSYDVLFIDGIRKQSKDEIRKALVGIGLGIQKLGKFALDANDGYQTQTKTLAGIPESVKLITARLSMLTRIPSSILMFENPGGLNSGENAGDWEAFFGQVAADQPKHYVPPVRSVLTDVLASRRGPTAGQRPMERWRVKPRPLGQLSPEKAATVENTRALRRASDVTSGIITVEEARREPDVVRLYSIDPEAAPVAGAVEADAEEPLGEPEPEPTPGKPPDNESLVAAAVIKQRYGVGLRALKSMIRKKQIRGWKYPSGWKVLESEVAAAGLHNPEPDPVGQEVESST